MKTMKKFVSLALALMMALALMAPAFAEENDGGTTKTGSITISNAVKGETYKLVKLFDATFNEDKTAYAYTGTIPEALETYFVKDANGNIEATNAAKGEDGTLSSAAVSAIKDWAAKQTGTEKTADGNELVFDNLTYGYYVVVSRSTNDNEDSDIPGGAVSVTTTNPNPTIVDKNDGKPHFPDGEGKKVDKKVVEVGETVTYTVSYITVNWIGKGDAAKQVISYTVADTLPDFLSNVQVTKITISGQEISAQQFDENKQIKIDWAEKGSLECTDTHEHTDACYAWTSKYDNGAKLEITYTATVNEKVLNSDAADAEHKNTVTVTPTTTDGAGEPNTDDETVYTAIINIDKYAENKENKEDTSKKLAGAKFVLKNNEGKFYTWVEAVTDDDGKVTTPAHVEWVDTQDKATEANKGIVVTDDTGVAAFKGLKPGTYTLVEIEAPAGYNKLDKDVTVEIKVTDENDQPVETQANITQPSAVANSTGALLPSTGGIGTTIFYVVGGVLVVGAAILLMTRKRVRDEE